MNNRMIRILVSASLLGLADAAAGGTFTTIDVPGATATDASGINASGEIVGTYTDSSGASHGFRLRDGVFTAIDYPGATGTFAVTVNSRGDVAGFFLDSATGWHGFVLSGDSYFVQEYPGATTGSFTLGISANATLVGEFKTGQAFGQLGYAWIMRHGQYTQLTPPSCDGATPSNPVQAFATAVNPRGDVVGRLIDGANRQCAWKLDNDGVYGIIQFPGASLTNARGINSRSEVVGVYRLGVNHGFVLPANDLTSFTTIDFPVATSTRALGINSCGDIVGTYALSGAGGTGHGFLLARDIDDDRCDDP